VRGSGGEDFTTEDTEGTEEEGRGWDKRINGGGKESREERIEVEDRDVGLGFAGEAFGCHGIGRTGRNACTTFGEGVEMRDGGG
jgi:hypothetical protein